MPTKLNEQTYIHSMHVPYLVLPASFKGPSCSRVRLLESASDLFSWITISGVKIWEIMTCYLHLTEILL